MGHGRRLAPSSQGREEGRPRRVAHPIHDAPGPRHPGGVVLSRHGRTVPDAYPLMTPAALLASALASTPPKRAPLCSGVGPAGLEPATYGLKVRSSTIELEALGARGICRENPKAALLARLYARTGG